jgi:hypothetical protein
VEAAMPSTAVGRIEYDEETQLLFVDFVANGRRYIYFDVPWDEVGTFKHAFSKGTYFNTHIRDRYRHELVFDPRMSV